MHAFYAYSSGRSALFLPGSWYVFWLVFCRQVVFKQVVFKQVVFKQVVLRHVFFFGQMEQ